MAINTFAVLALSPLDVQIAFGLEHTESRTVPTDPQSLDRH